MSEAWEDLEQKRVELDRREEDILERETRLDELTVELKHVRKLVAKDLDLSKELSALNQKHISDLKKIHVTLSERSLFLDKREEILKENEARSEEMLSEVKELLDRVQGLPPRGRPYTFDKETLRALAELPQPPEDD